MVLDILLQLNNSLMVAINNRQQQQLAAVDTNQEGMVLHRHSHQVPHIAKVVHISKVGIPKLDMGSRRVILPHNQQIHRTNNHPALDNMVARHNLVTNRVDTKGMVVVVTHHPVQLSLLGMVKAMVVSLEGILNQAVQVVINLAATSNSMVDDPTREMVAMVEETEVMVVVIVAAVVVVAVVIIVVVVVIAMVTVVVVMVVVVVIEIVDMVIKEDMEGMYPFFTSIKCLVYFCRLFSPSVLKLELKTCFSVLSFVRWF